MAGVGGGLSSGKIAITICDRCGLKRMYSAVVMDGVKKGVWLCQSCKDIPSPWQLPLQVQDAYVLQHPRPDAYLTYDVYEVSDNPPVIITTPQAYPYPQDSFAAGSDFTTGPNIIIETNNNTPISTTNPPNEQNLNPILPPDYSGEVPQNIIYTGYVPPSQRGK